MGPHFSGIRDKFVNLCVQEGLEGGRMYELFCAFFHPEIAKATFVRLCFKFVCETRRRVPSAEDEPFPPSISLCFWLKVCGHHCSLFCSLFDIFPQPSSQSYYVS